MRRQKLTRSDREKRRGKRERRAARPAQQHRQELIALYTRARIEYDLACNETERVHRCVCERCGLEQDAGSGEILETGEVLIAGCEFCGCYYGETLESYQ